MEHSEGSVISKFKSTSSMMVFASTVADEPKVRSKLSSRRGSDRIGRYSTERDGNLNTRKDSPAHYDRERETEGEVGKSESLRERHETLEAKIEGSFAALSVGH